MIFKADKWRDYELIDCSDGERLERWGKVVMIRPDPQIIWQNRRESRLWSKADGVYKRSSAGGGSWVKNDMPDKWNISYGDLKAHRAFPGAGGELGLVLGADKGR